MKTSAERSIEALTWAAVVIWLGFALVAHILNYVWLVVMMLGIILLSSAIYQRSRGWHTSLSLWIFGIWMAVFSVLETVSTLVGALTDGEGLGIDLWVYLGIALVSMGVAVVFRTIQGPQLVGEQRKPSQRQSSRSTTRQQYSAPRRVDTDYSTGYTPAPQEQAQYDDYGYTDRAPASRAQQVRARYDQPRDDLETQYTQRSQRAPQERQRTTARPQRRARPAPEPNDLEARVDDIIRRSRERRGGETDDSSGDLPY